MKLIVISPEAEDPREHAILAEFFAADLTSYHLRKPIWTRPQLVAWLHALPSNFHPRIVLHTHHDLALEFPLGGLHDRDSPQSTCHVLSDNAPLPFSPHNDNLNSVCHLIRDKHPVEHPSLHSRAVHDLPTLRSSLDTYDRLLLSPIFPSLSKSGHHPSPDLSSAALRTVLALPRRAEVIALGGIEATRIPACRELGFDGVAVLGAIWQAADPMRAFTDIQNASASSAISAFK